MIIHRGLSYPLYIGDYNNPTPKQPSDVQRFSIWLFGVAPCIPNHRYSPCGSKQRNFQKLGSLNHAPSFSSSPLCHLRFKIMCVYIYIYVSVYVYDSIIHIHIPSFPPDSVKDENCLISWPWDPLFGTASSCSKTAVSCWAPKPKANPSFSWYNLWSTWKQH